MDFLEAVRAIGGKDLAYEVGIVTMDIPNVDGYKEDDIVIFQRESHGRDSDTLTAAIPYYSAAIKNGRVEDNHLFSRNAIVNVPSKYVSRAEDLTSLI